MSDAVVLRAPAAGLEATVVPSAGMVVASLRHDGDELLGQRGGLTAYREQGKTFGIPFLHPWANRLGGDDYGSGPTRVELPEDSPLVRREEHGLPIHGLLAASPLWVAEPASDAAVAAELDVGAHPELLAAFPFPHRLRLEVELAGPTLRVTVRVTATGVIPVPLAFGFHPYLQLPGVPRAQWRVELPDRDVLDADERGIPTGGAVHHAATTLTLGTQVFDEGMRGLGDAPRFALAGGGRRLEVAFEEGWSAGQLFAPDTTDVVCFEPMAAETNALRSGRGLRAVAPGRTAVAAFSVTVHAD